MATITDDHISVDTILAIDAANIGDLTQDLEAFPAIKLKRHEKPTSAEVMAWNDFTIKSISTGLSHASRSDAMARGNFVSVCFCAEITSSEYYEHKLKERSAGIPKDRNSLTLGIAYHYQLDVTHNKHGKDHSKFLYRYVSAAKEFKDIYESELGSLDTLLNPTGIQAGADLVKTLGGIAKLEAAFRARQRSSADTSLVALDGDAHAEMRLANIEDRLKREELFVGWGRLENDSVKISELLKLSPEVQKAVASQFKVVDPKVAFVKELFAVGKAIPAITTNLPKNPADDPKAKGTAMRVTLPHYLFHNNAEMSITTVGVEASPVVRVLPKVQLIDVTVQGDVEFRTQECVKIERNLTDDRADAFEVLNEQPKGTTTVATRLLFKSPVAKPNKDQEKMEMRLPIQQVYSANGNVPLVLADFQPQHDLGPVRGVLPAMLRMSDGCRLAAKEKTAVSISASGSAVTFKLSEVTETVNLHDKTASVSVRVHPEDFEAVTRALENLAIIGSTIEVSIDPDMLVLSFGTASAAYAVHIPAVRSDFARDNRHMSKIQAVVWPGLGPDSPADAAAK